MAKKKSDERWNQILQKERFIRLSSGNKVPGKPRKNVKARGKWGTEAFLRAGETSFSDDEH